MADQSPLEAVADVKSECAASPCLANESGLVSTSDTLVSVGLSSVRGGLRRSAPMAPSQRSRGRVALSVSCSLALSLSLSLARRSPSGREKIEAASLGAEESTHEAARWLSHVVVVLHMYNTCTLLPGTGAQRQGASNQTLHRLQQWLGEALWG